MTPGMTWLLIAWGIVTGILLLLLFYRSTLTRQEDDQLFIDETASSMATEQRQLIAKLNKINPIVKLVGATSGLMILIIAGWAVYIGLNSVQRISAGQPLLLLLQSNAWLVPFACAALVREEFAQPL